jgi:alpha-galactosidase/6-phospho-beta-glucosidase family protein
MKFKVKDNITIEGIPAQTVEEFKTKVEKNSSVTTFETFIKDEIVELLVNNINDDGFSFDAFYTRSNGEKLYLFDLGVNEFEKIEE